MLTAVAIASVAGWAIAVVGWIAAWRSRGQAIDAHYLAHAAGDRARIIETQTSSIRLSETLANNATAEIRDQLTAERERAAALRHQLGKATADIDVLRRKIESMTPTGQEIYDSTTKRLSNPAALARKMGA